MSHKLGKISPIKQNGDLGNLNHSIDQIANPADLSTIKYDGPLLNDSTQRPAIMVSTKEAGGPEKERITPFE